MSESKMHQAKFQALLIILCGLLLTLAQGKQRERTGGTAKGGIEGEAVNVPWSVIYHDGNANGFRFWKDSSEEPARFEFSPVRPETSSSGVYSGGKPLTGTIDNVLAGQLWRWIRRLEAETSLRTEARKKGTGAFRVKEAANSERKFVIRNGTMLREFNEFLAHFR